MSFPNTSQATKEEINSYQIYAFVIWSFIIWNHKKKKKKKTSFSKVQISWIKAANVIICKNTWNSLTNKTQISGIISRDAKVKTISANIAVQSLTFYMQWKPLFLWHLPFSRKAWDGPPECPNLTSFSRLLHTPRLRCAEIWGQKLT